MKIKIYLILACIFIIFNKLEAQNDIYSVRLIARPTTDSIMLRWAPMNYETWQQGNKEGYIVERYLLMKNWTPLAGKQVQVLTPDPLKPYSLDHFENLSEIEEYAAVAAQAIYGNDFEVETDDNVAIAMFNKATQQQNQYSFALFAADYSAEVAKASALMFVDRNINPGEKYLYVVYPVSHDSIRIDTAYAVTGVDEIIPLPKPRLVDSEGGDKSVFLFWDKIEGRNNYTSFFVERSEDGGKSFQQRNDKPIVNTYEPGMNDDHHFYLDSLPENGVPYIYRVRGRSPFGEYGPYSDTIAVVGNRKLGEIPRITSHEPTIHGVEIKWEFSKKSRDIIEGFRVLRSKRSNHDFQILADQLRPDQGTFLDKNPMNTAYYKIIAFDKQGSHVASFPVLVQLLDTIPPSVPKGMVLEADTTGKVTLRWNANLDEDIYGYRIYRANARHEEFSLITPSPVQDTVYEDQINLKTLTKKVYYKLMAIDQRQNHSVFSDIFELSRPDIVPPASPVLRNFHSSADGNCLEWTNSSSDDVEIEAVFRKLTSDEAWEQLIGLEGGTTSYCDTSAERGVSYQYAIKAIDYSGNISAEAKVVSMKRSQRGAKQMMINSSIDRNEKYIEISWKPIVGTTRCVIYRCEGQTCKLSTHDSGTFQDGKYLDSKISPDSQYTYLVKLITDKGIILSKTISVRY